MTHEWFGRKWHVVAGMTLGVLLVMGAGLAQAQAVGTAAVRGRVVDESGAGL